MIQVALSVLLVTEIAITQPQFARVVSGVGGWGLQTLLFGTNQSRPQGGTPGVLIKKFPTQGRS